ncbi:MAG: mercuric reductase, partial [Bacteroidota bacterium]|nr:mercuric reductase [Bacteroidota bacterium]
MKHFDAIIIGSGQGGTPLSKKLAKQGWKTALIEMLDIGGSCINVGCTPTKTMVASAKAAYDIKRAGLLGVETGSFQINMPAIIRRKKKVVERFRHASQKDLANTENLSLIFGTASFIDSKTIGVEINGGGTDVLTADKIFIDTGTRPAIPAIEGLQETGYFTSTTLMEYEEIPSHLLIIGGGYIGLEFGQMYRRFGSRITILEFTNRFLKKEDEDISNEILSFLGAEQIEVLINTKVTSLKKKGDAVMATLQVDGEEKNMECSHILLSAGRTPNTENLRLEKAGVDVDKHGYIMVNEKLETCVEGIYAIGDVKGGPEFTHISYNDYVILYNNLVKGKNENITGRMVPYTLFTDPQLGRIGMTEQEARQKGLNIKVAKIPMSRVARAIETGDTRGMMKAITDAESGKILGAAIVGQEGGEVM